VIVVDTGLNALWYYDNGKLIKSFHVATGKHIEGVKPTAANQEQNYYTPLGTYTIGFKAPGMYYGAKKIPAGDPASPLGTRWLGFSVYPGDKAAVWGIHGTDRPEEIGSWVSTGCIRLTNEDVETLYAIQQISA
jgi:lipoprotein-anchoring transpeptidase ErfK/SrfK